LSVCRCSRIPTSGERAYPAKQLRLAPYEWRLANRVEDLQGVTAENIVLVFPVLGPNSPYRDACEYAHHIAARDGVKLKTVTV
jgi:hypothetical protein